MFEALEGQKSHWFRFMDILIKGCLKVKSPLATRAKLVTDACFDKAVKISQVYSRYNIEKYQQCFIQQTEELSKNEHEKYDSSRSKSFLDRDYLKYKEMSIELHPSITVNGEKFEGDYTNTNELFKMICSKLEDRPDLCKAMGLSYTKELIKKEYENEYGEEGSVERAVITFDRIKEA